MTSPYTLPGLPSDLLSSDKPGERRLKVDAEIILPPVEVDLPDEYPLPASQVAALTPQTDALTDAELRAAPVVVDTGLVQPTTPADVQPTTDPSHGTFAYKAGVSGTVNVPIGGRVRSIMAANTGLTPASLSINGGDSIAVPVGGSFSVEIGGSLSSATITFTSTTQYFVSWVS